MNVGDIDRSLDFYTGILGLKPERVAEFKAGTPGIPFCSVRVNEHTVIDLFPIKDGKSLGLAAGGEGKIQGNLDHFCFVVSSISTSNTVRSVGASSETLRVSKACSQSHQPIGHCIEEQCFDSLIET